MFNPRLLTSSILLILLLAGCAQSPESCPPHPPADLSGAIAFAGDDQLPFRFPLDELGNDVRPYPAIFCTSGGSGSAREYHAAEDYHLPAGTPVYAMADGNISFSGPMGGYGWLIIIDHPQANLYSLYGHLSPSRWRKESGTVEKGELIAYLGDPDENGGSPEQGWLQPSAIITGQDIPVGGFPEPAAGFVAKWGLELLFTGVYLFGGACMLVFAIRKNEPFLLALSGVMLIAAGWILHNKGTKTSYALFAMAVLFSAIGIYKLIRRPTKMPRTQS